MEEKIYYKVVNCAYKSMSINTKNLQIDYSKKGKIFPTNYAKEKSYGIVCFDTLENMKLFINNFWWKGYNKFLKVKGQEIKLKQRQIINWDKGVFLENSNFKWPIGTVMLEWCEVLEEIFLWENL